ncbi:hypothetical protein CLOP_g7483 [Closterium sp. NIES-67]|nr:hypothetical protein CLOP_g7483 [Closterium sp. NIES-67]
MAASTACTLGAAVAWQAAAKIDRAAELLSSASCAAKMPLRLVPSAKASLQASASSRRVTRCAAADNTAAAASAATEAPAAEITDTSAFIADVASLIKLVDSRDIVELELKQAGVEILIRKKEALPAPAPPPAPAAPAYPAYPPPHMMAHSPYAEAPPPPAAAAPAPAASKPAAAPAAPAPPPPVTLPPMVSPMAGTFYSSPAPGEPAFLKVGDTVTKGQVVCIVEAMKLMNEIEADQSGTVVAILAEDGKPVAVGAPLFTIKP